MSTPENSSYERSEQGEERHRLIEEFRRVLNESGEMPDPETDSVVVLSGPPELGEDGLDEKSPENIARIEYGIEVIKKVVGLKLNKPVEEISDQDIESFGPDLVLNGSAEQLQPMYEIVESFNFPLSKVTVVNAGGREQANTQTQFLAIENDSRFTNKKIIYLTSSYHVPRTARTADANVSPEAKFEVMGAPQRRYPVNVYQKVKGEIRRIISYSERGVISKEPRST